MSEPTVQIATPTAQTSPGSAGGQTQVPGAATTMSNAAAATGGIAPGNFVEPDIDDELFKFSSDDTPLMNLMLKAKKVNVDSPEVEHYMIDEPRSSVTTSAKLEAATGMTCLLPLPAEDQRLPQDHTTLRVRGVDGYAPDGKTKTAGKDLMLFVVGKDKASGNPIVTACNGVKSQPSDAYSKVPEIPAGTTIDILANALYETQKKVAPDLIVPQPTTVYLQKRGMNQVVSDYFDKQKKRIPFSQALIAEQAIANFKRKGNRSLWVGIATKFMVDTQLGEQYVYTTEGIRWQFKKELQHNGKWVIEQLIGLAKMFYTGEDVPPTAIGLCGKNFLENIQCIDFSKHPEIQVSVKTNSIGWQVTNIHTVFGDIELKREPTLDRLGYSNSAALLGENRLVHYVYKSEKSFEEDVEGEEAKRNGVLIWDGLGLKGTCHIWVDGEGEGANAGSTTFVMWDGTAAPSTTPNTKSPVYYLMHDVPEIAAGAKAGELWYFDGKAWKEYVGELGQ